MANKTLLNCKETDPVEMEAPKNEDWRFEMLTFADGTCSMDNFHQVNEANLPLERKQDCKDGVLTNDPYWRTALKNMQ